MSKVQDPQIEAFFAFNPTLGKEETEKEKNLLFYPGNMDQNEQGSYIGMCEGVIGFSLDFSSTPCHSIHTEKSRYIMLPCEKDHYVVIVISNPTVVDKSGKVSPVGENDITPQLDDQVLYSILKRFYSIFRFFNGTFAQVTHREGLNSLKMRLALLAQHFLPTLDLTKITYHMDIQGFRFLSVDRTPFLTVQFLLASICAQYPSVKAGAVLYDSKLVWSGLSQECAQTLYMISQERLHPWFNAYLAANAAFFPPVREYPLPTKSKSKSNEHHEDELDEETAAKYADEDYACSQEEQEARRIAKLKAKESALGPKLPPLPQLPEATPAFSMEVSVPSGASGEDSLLPQMPPLPVNQTASSAVISAVSKSASSTSAGSGGQADSTKNSPSLQLSNKLWPWSPLSLSGYTTGPLRISPVPPQSTPSESADSFESKVPSPDELRGVLGAQDTFLPSNLVPRVFNALPVTTLPNSSSFELNRAELSKESLTVALRARAEKAARALAQALEEEEKSVALAPTSNTNDASRTQYTAPPNLADFLSDKEEYDLNPPQAKSVSTNKESKALSSEPLYLVGYLCHGLTLYLVCSEPTIAKSSSASNVELSPEGIEQLLKDGFVPGPGYVDADGFVVRSPALPGTRAPPLGRGSGRLSAPIDISNGRPKAAFKPTMGGFTKNHFSELETYSRTNLAMLAEIFREQLLRGANSTEQFRFLYFCQMNLALKSTVGVSLGPQSSALVPSSTTLSAKAQQNWSNILANAGPSASSSGSGLGANTSGSILSPAVVRVIRQMRAEFAASAQNVQQPLAPLVHGQADPDIASTLTYDEMISAALAETGSGVQKQEANIFEQKDSGLTPENRSDIINLANSPPKEICVRTKSNGWVVGRRATTSSREFYVILDDKNSPNLGDVQRQMEALSKNYFYSIFIY